MNGITPESIRHAQACEANEVSAPRTKGGICALLNGVALMAFLLQALLWTGCATVPTINPASDPELAYIVNTYEWEKNRLQPSKDAAREAARIIAERALDRRKRLVQRGVLKSAKAFGNDLRSRVEVLPHTIMGAGQLTPKQKQTLMEWVLANPRAMYLNGSDVSTKWKMALSENTRTVAALTKQLGDLVKRAERLATEGEVEEAVQCVNKALKIDPADTAVQELSVSLKRVWAKARLESAVTAGLAADLRSVRETVATFGGDAVNEAEIASSLEILNGIQSELLDFANWARKEADLSELDQPKGGYRMVMEEMSRLRGRCWAERMHGMCVDREYWAAYEYAVDRLALRQLNLSRSGSPAKWYSPESADLAILRDGVQSAFEAMLPDSVMYYVQNAGQRLGEGYAGLSLIYCRMAQELIVFARSQNFGFTEVADPTHQRLAELREAQLQQTTALAQERASEDLTRKFVVETFDSKDDTGEDVARLIVGELIKRASEQELAKTPLLYTSVVVEHDGKEGVTAADYVLSGSVGHLYVDQLPAKEVRVEDVDIGRRPRQIPNRDRETRRTHPQVYEQDVICIVRRTSRIAKIATVKLDAFVEHGGSTISVASFDQAFDGIRTPLPGATLVDNEIDIDQVGMRTRTAFRMSELPTSDIPPNVPAELSKDRDVKTQVLRHVVSRIVRAVESFLANYPLTDLVDASERHRVQQKRERSADSLGLCYEYFYLMVSRDRKFEVEAGDGRRVPAYDYLKHCNKLGARSAISQKVNDMARTAWPTDSTKSDLVAKCQNLWRECVASAIDLAAQNSQ